MLFTAVHYCVLLYFAVFCLVVLSVEIEENFDFASPVEVLRAMKIYCISFYGCML